MTKQKFGFTLAEVLIVIGIIGVVAALTLPNLNHATGDKEKVTKVKKIYSNLTEAVDRAQVIYGDFNTWFKDIDNNYEACNERIAKRVTEFLKISKDCGFNSGCFSSAPLIDVNGDEFTENLLDFIQNDSYPQYMVTLTDGTSLSFYRDPYNDGSGTKHNLEITVDIDGPNKGKNQRGNDIFKFVIYDKDNPYLSPGDYECNTSCIFSANGNYFTKWVVENGNLDYLKCPDELNWKTKTSCE